MRAPQTYTGFAAHSLDEQHVLYERRLPAELIPDETALAELWSLHPADYHKIHLHGRNVATPRWQQAYGADYHYTGRVNRALPVEPVMQPYLDWGREQIHPRLNGLLFNWYDGERGHYIGKHRDSTKGMVDGAPIVTISLGETRVFRLRPWKQSGYRDFEASHGTVFVMPYATNLAWTHEVPHFKKWRGRRISVTLRAFHQTRA